MSRIFCFATASVLLLSPSWLAADQIRWAPDFEAAQQAARDENKLLLIHFGASWCAPCRNVEENVFPSPSVAQTIHDNFVPLKVDADRETELCSRFGIDRLPTDVVVKPDGTIVHRMTTPKDPREYVDQLAAISMTKSPRPAVASRWGANVPQAQTPGVNIESPVGQEIYQFGRGQESVPLNGRGTPSSLQSRFADPGGMDVGTRQQETTAAPSSALMNAYADGVSPARDAQAVSNEITNPYADSRARQSLPASAEPGQFASNATRPASTPASGQEPPQQAPLDVGPIMPAQAEIPTGLDGRCPVTLVTKRIWQKGDRRYGAIHRGYLYLFAGEQEQRMFLEKPDDYSPVLAGMDVVRLTEQRAVVAGDRRYGVLYDADGPGPDPSRIYLFDSAESRNRFESAGWPEKNLQPVFQAMEQGTLGTYLR